MPDPLPDYPRLHALLGDAVRDLPDALAEKMEDALSDAAESLPPSAFFTFLQSHGKGRRAVMEHPGAKLASHPAAHSIWPWRPAAHRASPRSPPCCTPHT